MNKRRWRGRCLAWLMTLCMIITGAPANALQALAAGEKALSPAAVYLIWATMDGDNIVANSHEINDVQPAGKTLIAKYVTNGTYHMQDGDDQLFFGFNNAIVDLSELEDLPEGWALSGDTEIAMANMTVCSDSQTFPAYSGEVTAEGITSFYNQGPYTEDGWIPYDYVITGDYSIYGFFDARELIINEGATLTLDVFTFDGDTETSGSYLTVGAIDVAGTLRFEEPEISDHNTGLEVHGDLIMESTGSVVPYDGALIVFTDSANCDDTFAGNFYEADGETLFTFPSTDWCDFYWSDGAGRWILGQGGDGPEVGDNEFFVDYDERWDRGQATAKVLLGTEVLPAKERFSFTAGTALNFTLQKPDGYANETPIVYVETNDGKVYATYMEGDANIALNGNAFMFTPETSAGFIMRVWWNDFDMFGFEREESEFVLRTNSGGGTITVNVDSTKKMVNTADPIEIKRIYSKDAFAGDTKLTLTFTPNEGRHLSNVNIWADNQEYNYVLNQPGEHDLLLNEENGFVENNGVYTYVITNYQLGYGYGIWAWFEDDNEGLSKPVEDNQYFVCYEEFKDEQNVSQATVTVNNSVIPCNEIQSFTKNVGLSFVLHPHESRMGCTPIVHLNVKKGQYFSSKENEVDANHLITLTKSGDDYTFSYVPTTDDGFEVTVWWSDYDYFSGWGNEFTMESRYNGQGSIFVSPGTDRMMTEPGEGSTGARRIYDYNVFENGGKVRVSFLPDEGWHLNSVWISTEEKEYNFVTYESTDKNDTPILQAGSGFTLEDGIYSYEMTKAPGNDWISFNVDFREDPSGVTFNTWGQAKVEYKIGNANDYATLTQNDPDKRPEISLAELGDATSLTLRLTPLFEDVTIYAIDVNWRDGSADERFRVRLDNTGIYTINRGTHSWENCEVEVINWQCPCDGEYVFEMRGDGEISLSDNLKFDQQYNFTVNSPITFTVTGTHYRVVVSDNYGYYDVVNGEGNTYTYVPTTNKGIRFEIYADQVTYEYDYIEVDHENGEFTAEYGVHTDPWEGQAGGTVSLDATPVRSAIRGDWKRVVLKDVQLMHLTIAPKTGYDYRIEQDGQDVTAAVKGNGNVYEWNTSEPWNIARIEIWFEKSNQYYVDYDECLNDNVRHATVTVNNVLVPTMVSQTFVENVDLNFVLHPHEARIGCTPIVEIKVRDNANTFYCSAPGTDDEHKITLTPSGDDFTFTFTPRSQANFEVTVYWSEYDRFRHGEGEFTIETRYDGNGSITMNPAPDHFMNESGQNNTGVRNVYSKDIFEENGAKIRLAFIPAPGYYLRGVRVNADKEYNYVNYNTDENGFIPILSQDSGFVLENGVYYYEVTDVPIYDWLYVHADFGPEPTGIKVNNAHDSVVKYKIGNAQDYSVLAQPSSNEDPEITRAELGNAESVTLQVTAARDGYVIYGLNIVQYDVFNHEISNNYVYLDPDDTYVLERGEGSWNSWTVKIVDWICPFDGEYVINQRGPGELSLLGDLEFNEFYNYTPGQPIQFQVVGSHYEVWIKPNVGEWTEVHEDNGVYSYQPEGNCGVEFVVFTTKEMHDFDFTWPEQEGDFTAEYGVCTPSDDDTVGGTITPSPTPVKSISYWGRTRYILNGMTTLSLTITPNEGCTYRVEENGVFVTEAVKSNGDVYEWNVADPAQIPELTIYFDKEEEKEPAFIRTALAEFTGQIGVAFLVEIPDWLAQDEGAYAEFTKNGVKTTRLVSEAPQEELGEYTVRRFRQLVVAKEYGDVINFRLYDGNGDPVQLVGYNGDYTATGANLSLEQYVNYIKANAGNYEEKDVELVTALEDYCNVARIHFGYNSAGLTPSAAVQAIQNSDFNNYAQVVTGTKPAEVSKGDITVSFESDNSLKLYFTYSSTEVNPNSLSYAIDGKGATLCQDSKGYFIALRNIPAKYLDQPHYFSVSNGTETLTIYMSALTYARIIVTSGSDYTEDEKNLGRALFIYNRAARSYFNVTDTY